ncbi:hypothetical protein LOK49_LG06G01460 [Camellia lanceoleosa]|uniref:Uncharacterized protein n=1 Tax=Camellia lanceoleosa TaxID=1840588 RepID=A0ACC0HA57_9ERIC|nr:hypothetical protein LOK49_LG06G01460 [Camellia lanceoleosa]
MLSFRSFQFQDCYVVPNPPSFSFLEEIILGSGQNFVVEVQIGYLSSNVGSSTELKMLEISWFHTTLVSCDPHQISRNSLQMLRSLQNVEACHGETVMLNDPAGSDQQQCIKSEKGMDQAKQENVTLPAENATGSKWNSHREFKHRENLQFCHLQR